MHFPLCQHQTMREGECEMSNRVRQRKSVRTCGRFHSMIVLVNIDWNVKQSKQTYVVFPEHILITTSDPPA